MIRIPIRLNDESLTALRTLARLEYRDVRQQAAWIIEHELARRGLLVIETQADPAPVAAVPAGASPLVGEDPKSRKGRAHVTD